MIHFDCPKCQTQLQFDDAARGTIVRCTACNQQLRLPAARGHVSEKPLPSSLQQVQASPPSTAQQVQAAPPPLPDVHTDEWPYFEPIPNSGGGMSPVGAVLLPLVLIPMAVGIGWLGSFVSQWIHIIIVFPALLGLAVGGVGLAIVHFGKVRSKGFVALISLVAATITMLSGFYFDYQRFLRDLPIPLNEITDAERRLETARIDHELAQPGISAKRREDLKIARNVLKIRGLFSFIDFSARDGVRLGRVGGRGKNDRGMNLGYVGSYIYWGVEWLIVLLVIAGLMGVKATQPFCDECDTWKQKQFLGGLRADHADVKRAVIEGDLTFLAEHAASSTSGNLKVEAGVCPNCESDAPFELTVTPQAIAKHQYQHLIVTATYPGEALPVLEELFHPRRQPHPPGAGQFA